MDHKDQKVTQVQLVFKVLQVRKVQLVHKAQQVQLRHGLGLVIVDYLQLMRPSDGKAAKSQNRTQVVGEMAWELKELARSMQVPVLVLSQLRRSAEEKDRPIRRDLREFPDD